jgi:teichuronic acid biosynthesis glycosyltransferase TuaC
MKVLFVSSGRNPLSISPIVKSQGESLRQRGLEIIYFSIKGRGLFGYLRSIFLLRKSIIVNKPEIIHAHYSLCCIVAALATRLPIVVSLMGSDLKVNRLMIKVIRILSKISWKAIIVKSKNMKDEINLEDAYIIPNGVDFTFFKPLDQAECKQRVGFDTLKKQVLFMADPSRYSKNHELAVSAFQLANKKVDRNIELKIIYGIEHHQVVYYMNAADVILLTSRWEGSPNIIKEAMACNIPIVSTKVGDVEDVVGSTTGCFLADSSDEDISDKLKLALDFNGRTSGRENIKHLDSKLIADKIIKIYSNIL